MLVCIWSVLEDVSCVCPDEDTRRDGAPARVINSLIKMTKQRRYGFCLREGLRQREQLIWLTVSHWYIVQAGSAASDKFLYFSLLHEFWKYNKKLKIQLFLKLNSTSNIKLDNKKLDHYKLSFDEKVTSYITLGLSCDVRRSFFIKLSSHGSELLCLTQDLI